MNIIKVILITTALFSFTSAHSAIVNVDLDTTVNQTLLGDSAWLNEDTFSDGLDFFILNIDAPKNVGIQITADIFMGLSIYAGEISNEFGFVFNNSGDFSDFFSDLSYVGGMSGLVPGFSNPEFLIDLVAGTYTIAVGGNTGLFDTTSVFDYSVAFTDNSASSVSAPLYSLTILFIAIALLARAKRQNCAH